MAEPMMQGMETACGIAGTAGFGWACAPTAWKTFRAGKSIGTPVGLAWNVFGACLFMYVYLLTRNTFDWLVFSSGAVEVLAYAVVLWYHYFPRNEIVALMRQRVREQNAYLANVKRVLDPKPLDAMKQRLFCPHGYFDWDNCPDCCH